MFYKDGLYYSTYPKEEAYFFKDGVYNRIEELKDTRAMLIALDDNKNIYFSNSSGLFKYNKSNKEILTLGVDVVNGMNSDANGKLYFTSPNGIFRINDKLNTIERLVTLENVYGAAIEKDGSVLCGTDEGIIRFKKSDKCKL
ncbi:Ommochrome-binding protein [Papilio machaon]|uniref:Ommochrome-binding protein n=1 Tax=Papilio machaon TaxID=76193 RepID=A0A194RN46_PAPMA|nr:Ommochrome-binding protein [Papilio machaon]